MIISRLDVSCLSARFCCVSFAAFVLHAVLRSAILQTLTSITIQSTYIRRETYVLPDSTLKVTGLSHALRRAFTPCIAANTSKLSIQRVYQLHLCTLRVTCVPLSLLLPAVKMSVSVGDGVPTSIGGLLTHTELEHYKQKPVRTLAMPVSSSNRMRWHSQKTKHIVLLTFASSGLRLRIFSQ